MDSYSLKIDTDGMGTVTFAGHGGSSAMGAVDDVTPTAYGESWDIVSGTMDTGGKTGTNCLQLNRKCWIKQYVPLLFR